MLGLGMVGDELEHSRDSFETVWTSISASIPAVYGLGRRWLVFDGGRG